MAAKKPSEGLFLLSHHTWGVFVFWLEMIEKFFSSASSLCFLPRGDFTLSTPEPLEESISHTTTFQPVITGMSCPCRLLGPSASASFILSDSLMVHFPMDIWHAFPSSVHLSVSLLSFFFFFSFTQYNRHWISLWLNVGKYRHGTALILWNRIHEVIFFSFCLSMPSGLWIMLFFHTVGPVSHQG